MGAINKSGGAIRSVGKLLMLINIMMSYYHDKYLQFDRFTVVLVALKNHELCAVVALIKCLYCVITMMTFNYCVRCNKFYSFQWSCMACIGRDDI